MKTNYVAPVNDTVYLSVTSLVKRLAEIGQLTQRAAEVLRELSIDPVSSIIRPVTCEKCIHAIQYGPAESGSTGRPRRDKDGFITSAVYRCALSHVVHGRNHFCSYGCEDEANRCSVNTVMNADSGLAHELSEYVRKERTLDRHPEKRAAARDAETLRQTSKMPTYTRESSIEQYLVRCVERFGGMTLKQTAIAGIPDRLVLFPTGACCFVELKRPGEEPRDLQRARIRKLASLRFDTWVIDSPESVRDMLAHYSLL